MAPASPSAETATVRAEGRLTGAAASDLWGNPTVVLFGAALLTCVAGTAGFFTGALAAPLVVLINSAGLYLGFTVLHEAVHGVAHRRGRVGRALGTVTGFLLTFTFPFFRGVHLSHHAHTNHRGRDPDAVLGRLPPALAPWLGGSVLYASYHLSYFRHRLWRSRAELVEVVACDVLYLAILASAIALDWLPQLLILWVLPLALTLHVLVYTFDFLPHYPHDSTQRLYNARAYGGRLAACLHLNQNYHLVHHLWPAIPWYHYRRAYLRHAPALTAQGCRIGWRVRPLPPRAAEARSAAASDVLDRQIGGDLAGQRGKRDAAGPDRGLPAGEQPPQPPAPAQGRHGNVGQEPAEARR
jgi:beta-carotene hydroxylase